ncbi:unnamed protein product [Periconia digitata]|uniref:NYN domain-containing protein n=1 Tax=Periconia digitata TaxID=1303443 RepID=A0A9W4UJ50_9PLEO|nr:unnamed protein product [Periconia digitata]
MPSRPTDPGWEFGAALDLISSDTRINPPGLSSSNDALRVSVPTPKILHEKTSQQSLRLGNFGKLFAELGIVGNIPVPPISPVETDSAELSSSSDGNCVQPPAQPKKIKSTKEAPARLVDGTKSPTALTPKALSEDEERSRSPTKSLENSIPAGLSKGARRRARKQLEKALANKTEPVAPLEKKAADPPKDEKARPILVVPANTTNTKALAHKESDLKQQSRTPSRSNVGAKIRPATPVQVVSTPIILSKLSQNPLAAAFVPLASSQPAPSSVDALSHNASVPNQPTHVISYQSENGSFPSKSSNPTPLVQSVPLPVPSQHMSTPPRSSVNTYYTPQAQKTSIQNHGLIPRTVQPTKVPRSEIPIIPQHQMQPAQHSVVYPQATRMPFTPGKLAGPLTVRPKTDRNFHFFNQLLGNFPEDLQWLVSPMQLCNEKKVPQGLHVFVDASNIMIGFQWAMKKYRVAPFEISFDSLALLMERRRPVAKRVFAGSHREASPNPCITKLHQMSKAVGYENTINEQVLINREDSERKKFFKDVEKMGFQKAVEKSKRGSGSGSDSETGAADDAAPLAPATPRWVEQGVDEIIHLKMCQSIIDTEVPTTMVLATGDGAEAEHSDGFLAHVERALKKGWKIELVSWRQQTNGGYRNKKFRAKWGDRFKIIELDDYLEALIDTP